MVPLDERDGCSYSACHAAQVAKPQSFALRQPASHSAKGGDTKTPLELTSRKRGSELVMGENFGPQLQAASVIHGKHVHRGAAGGRNPHDAYTTKQKVLSPPFAPGVEKRHKLTTEGIHACKVRAFAKITAVTGQREIVDVIAPAMLLRDDMLDVMRQLAVRLGQQAILATVFRSAPNKLPRGGIHC
jgi:hypothetical protein